MFTPNFLVKNGFKASRIIAFTARMDDFVSPLLAATPLGSEISFADEDLSAAISSQPQPPPPYEEPVVQSERMLFQYHIGVLQRIVEDDERRLLDAAAHYMCAPSSPLLLPPVASAPTKKRGKGVKGKNPHERKIMADRLRRAEKSLGKFWMKILGPHKTNFSDWQIMLKYQRKVEALKALCEYFQ